MNMQIIVKWEGQLVQDDGTDTTEQELARILDATTEELIELGYDSASIAACHADMSIEIVLVLDRFEDIIRADASVRAALHAAEVATPDWGTPTPAPEAVSAHTELRMQVCSA